MSNRPWRILVADDDPTAALLFPAALAGGEFELTLVDNGLDALAAFRRQAFDMALLDVEMPGLDGMALARVVAKFSTQPQIVFVTAHDQHAVDAFALDATDYVMKPVRQDRLREAVRKVLTRCEEPGGTETDAPDETIPVELGGVTRFISRRQIRYAQAQGDYARLHTENGSHLVRIPLSTLEEQWGEHGFVRIHRSTLVALPHVSEVRMDHGRCSVVVGTTELQVSRRHTKALRDLVLRRQGRP